ncbi:hypothetical protein [uncultured Oscillibacter sp.]|uniref:hypothetical protein n=1 Tax=uncultured Oscillibacter sp. TaxID=876091 RepID=UPI0025E20A7A|nr:hypothetical protein [uncultured Oscillibacter sp.]
MKRHLMKGAHGDGFPLTIAVTLCLLLIFCWISEYFRMTLIAQGVRNALQQSVISAINDNYDDVYHSVREGYAAGWMPTDDAWEESVDTGNIYVTLASTLGLTSDGTSYIKHSGDEVEYSISGLTVNVSNNNLASGESDGFVADAAITLEVPTEFAGSVLPPVRMLLKVEAKYTPKF